MSRRRKLVTHPPQQTDEQAAILQRDCIRHGGHRYQFGDLCINCGFAPLGLIQKGPEYDPYDVPIDEEEWKKKMGRPESKTGK